MTEPDIVMALMPLLDCLEQLGVSYQIGGSVATSVYGVPRSTLDVDLVADLPESCVDPMVQQLEDAYYIDAAMIRDAIRRRASFNLIHLASMVKIDVFALKRRPFDEQAFRRRRMDTLAEDEDARRLPISTPEDMVLHKLDWYRKGGEVSERQWRDVIGVLRVQGDSLDRAYLDHWAAQLALEPLLTRALEEAGRHG